MSLQSIYLLTESIGEAVGIPEDQIRMLLSLVLCVPLGHIFKQINSRLIRDIYGVFFGFALQIFVYGQGTLIILLQSTIAYLLVLIFQRNSAKIVFFESLLFQSSYHIYRQYVDFGGWKLDITTIMMMYTCKYTSFAYCYQDGGKPEEKLSQDQKDRRIQRLPNILSYFSYIYFFAGALIGPSYDFTEYRDFIHMRKIYASIPSTLAQSTKTFLKSWIFMVLIVLCSKHFPLDLCGMNEFGDYSLFFQFYFINVAATIGRCRYYSGWLMTQSGVDATGLSFGGIGKDGTYIWDNVLTADPSLELLASPKEKIDKWNASVAAWLRRYVYFRICSEEESKKKPQKAVFAQNATYIVSAIWHGFYPSYYVSFVHWGFVSTLSRYFYKLSLNYPKFNYNNPIYRIIRFICPNFMMNYYGMAFYNLRFSIVMKFFKNTLWIPNIVIYVLMIFFTVTGFGQGRPKGTKDNSTESTKYDNISTSKQETEKSKKEK